MLKHLAFLVLPLVLFGLNTNASNLSDAVVLSTVQTVLSTGSKIVERNQGVSPAAPADDNTRNSSSNSDANSSGSSQKEDFAGF